MTLRQSEAKTVFRNLSPRTCQMFTIFCTRQVRLLIMRFLLEYLSCAIYRLFS